MDVPSPCVPHTEKCPWGPGMGRGLAGIAGCPRGSDFLLLLWIPVHKQAPPGAQGLQGTAQRCPLGVTHKCPPQCWDSFPANAGAGPGLPLKERQTWGWGQSPHSPQQHDGKQSGGRQPTPKARTAARPPPAHTWGNMFRQAEGGLTPSPELWWGWGRGSRQFPLDQTQRLLRAVFPTRPHPQAGTQEPNFTKNPAKSVSKIPPSLIADSLTCSHIPHPPLPPGDV